jgi:hypothetical protein
LELVTDERYSTAYPKLEVSIAVEHILENAGKITAKIAKEFAESEFEKYRIIQDRLFESDFDKLVKQTAVKKKGLEGDCDIVT